MKSERQTNSLIFKPNPDVIIVGIEIMKLTNYENAGTSIVAFHTGRGGRFYNAGHTTFLGEKKISEFTYNLFVIFEKEDDILSAIGDRPNLIEKFEECKNKKDFSFFEKLGLNAGEQIYTDGNKPVGLSVAEAESGVGRIDIDGEYNTTSTCLVSDLSDSDIEIIIKSDVFDREYVLNEYAKYCGFEDYEIELMQYFEDYEKALINSLPQIKASDDTRTGFIYGLENFTQHDSDEDLNEKYIEIDGKFYTKN